MTSNFIIFISVMHSGQHYELALQLAQLLEIQIQAQQIDPFDPYITLQALGILFPASLMQLKEAREQLQIEQQWNVVLQCIEDNILNGETIQIQQLGQNEIMEIYKLIIDFVLQALEEEEQPEQQARQLIHPKRQQTKLVNNKSKNISIKQIDSKKRKGISKVELEQKQQKDKNKLSKQAKSKNESKSRSKSKSKSIQKAKSSQKVKKIKGKIQPKQREQKRVVSKDPIKSKVVANKSKPKRLSKDQQNLQDQIVKKIKVSMQVQKKKMPNKIFLKDPKSTQQVEKAKRKFEHYLKQFKQEGRKGVKVRRLKEQNGTVDKVFLKCLQKRQKNIQEEVLNEQIKYFMALREKKLAYINKIHKLTETLERQRLIEKQKEHRKLMEEERIKTQFKIQQGNGLFQKNMELLKDNFKAMRQKNDEQFINQRTVCKQMEECMKKKKMEQLDELKVLWQQQNMKLNNIVGDEDKIKNKLIDIYRKNRP